MSRLLAQKMLELMGMNGKCGPGYQALNNLLNGQPHHHHHHQPCPVPPQPSPGPQPQPGPGPQPSGDGPAMKALKARMAQGPIQHHGIGLFSGGIINQNNQDVQQDFDSLNDAINSGRISEDEAGELLTDIDNQDKLITDKGILWGPADAQNILDGEGDLHKVIEKDEA